MDLEPTFEPTLTATLHEREWILDALGGLYLDQWLTDVPYRVKGGKEATVYCCTAHPNTGLKLLAAKIYRPRMFRAMKNDAVYRDARSNLDADGKTIRDRRSWLAMKKHTRYGKQLTTASWIQHEYQTLRRLHEAGADVPRPLVQSGTALLMEYLGEPGYGAPTLHEVRLERDEARRVFTRLLRNVELFLACDCIHADLSAHNVLYWQGDFRVIDFPQAVDPATNPSAFSFLSRDVERLCQYFAKYGIEANAGRIAGDLWDRFTRAEL